MRLKWHWRRFFEFFFVGIVMGIVEDLIAIMATTSATVTLDMVYIVALVSLPFAIFSELFVDMIEFENNSKKKK